MKGSRPCPAPSRPAFCGLLVVLLGGGCAHQVSGLYAALQKARSTCEDVAEIKLDAPVRTPIAEATEKIDAARRAGKSSTATRLANRLSRECAQELEQRRALAEVIEDVKTVEARSEPRAIAIFHALTKAGEYSPAIFCGEGLVKHYPEQCQQTSAGMRTPSPQDSWRTAGAGGNDEEAALRRKPSRWPWVLVGVGGGLLVAGTVMAALAQGRYDQLGRDCPACTQDQIDGGVRFSVSADVMFSTGGAAVAGGLLWYLLHRFLRVKSSEDQEASFVPALTPFGGALSGRF
jgi:hypothetical protein